jgi:hypothetical protein
MQDEILNEEHWDAVLSRRITVTVGKLIVIM